MTTHNMTKGNVVVGMYGWVPGLCEQAIAQSMGVGPSGAMAGGYFIGTPSHCLMYYIVYPVDCLMHNVLYSRAYFLCVCL